MSPANSRPPSRRPGSLLGNIGLILASIAAGLVLLELGLRIWSVTWLTHWPNFVLGARSAHNRHEAQRLIDDSQLGYVPRPNYSTDGVNFDAEGLRRNGDAPVTRTDSVILAAGDSYTYGDEVKDGETWPAHLQSLSGERVLNAGVSGYGFDQTVLRTQMIAQTAHPTAIVVSFIADDIRRTEMRRLWGAEKPYFQIDNDRLILRNVPVPQRPDAWSTLNFWQRAFGWSYLIEFSVTRLGWQYDWYGNHVRAEPAGTGQRISCLLTQRLAALQASSGAHVLVMAQYDPYVWQDADFAAEQRRLGGGLLACAQQQGLATLDTFDALAATKAPNGPRGLYGQWHLNDQGNKLTAALVARALGATSH